MVLIHLMGGLGNQLFQYAAGKALSLHNNVPLKVHFEDHYKYAKRKMALWPFNIDTITPSKDELSEYLPKRGLNRHVRKVFNLPCNGKLYSEKEHFYFDPGFFSLPPDIYLSGFWQSYRYFSNINEFINGHFCLQTTPDDANIQARDLIQNCPNSVSIHFRRSDYLNPNSGFSALDFSYYEKAINYITSHIDNPVFFIFSDDTNWLLNNFSLKDIPYQIIDCNGPANAHDDLCLMSMCKHNIIANSSLSWWGAWLNPAPQKICIAPNKWSNTYCSNNGDLIPSDWVII